MALTITLNPAVDKAYRVPDFRKGNVHRTNKVYSTAGGKGLNVSRVLKDLGHEVTATGIIGDDNSDLITENLYNLDINCEFIEAQGITRTCLNIIDPKDRQSTEILESGFTVNEKVLDAFLNKYLNLLDKNEIIIASGSIPPGIPEDFYKKLIEKAKEKNKIFILDTSNEALKHGIIAKPHYIKPNKQEVKKLFNNEKSSSYKKLLKNLKEIGINTPIISLGSEGAMIYHLNQTFQLVPPKVKVINPVGSGDSFIAGLVAGIKEKENLLEAFKLAVASGTNNTQFFETGKVNRKTVDRYCEMIKIKKL